MSKKQNKLFKLKKATQFSKSLEGRQRYCLNCKCYYSNKKSHFSTQKHKRALSNKSINNEEVTSLKKDIETFNQIVLNFEQLSNGLMKIHDCVMDFVSDLNAKLVSFSEFTKNNDYKDLLENISQLKLSLSKNSKLIKNLTFNFFYT